MTKAARLMAGPFDDELLQSPWLYDEALQAPSKVAVGVAMVVSFTDAPFAIAWDDEVTLNWTTAGGPDEKSCAIHGDGAAQPETVKPAGMLTRTHPIVVRGSAVTVSTMLVG